MTIWNNLSPHESQFPTCMESSTLGNLYKIGGVEKESDLNNLLSDKIAFVTRGTREQESYRRNIAETGAKVDSTDSIMTSNSDPMMVSISVSSNIQK